MWYNQKHFGSSQHKLRINQKCMGDTEKTNEHPIRRKWQVSSDQEPVIHDDFYMGVVQN